MRLVVLVKRLSFWVIASGVGEFVDDGGEVFDAVAVAWVLNGSMVDC